MKTQDHIKSLIEDTLNRIPLPYDEVEVSDGEEALGIRFCVHTPEGHIFLNNNKENLLALNHIIKRMVESSVEEHVAFSLDVNNYQKERNEEIKGHARMMADRVRSLETPAELPPMSSYERMIVHSLFVDDADVETESVGRSPDRRVVIKIKSVKQKEVE